LLPELLPRRSGEYPASDSLPCLYAVPPTLRLQKIGSIGVVAVDDFALVTQSRHVVTTTWALEAQWPCHGPRFKSSSDAGNDQAVLLGFLKALREIRFIYAFQTKLSLGKLVQEPAIPPKPTSHLPSSILHLPPFVHLVH